MLLELDNIFWMLPSVTKDEVFAHIAKIAVQQGIAKKPKDVINALIERENLGETGLIDGFAIPHGISKKILNYGCFFVKTQAPLTDYLCLDGTMSQYLIFMLIPKKNYNESHIKNLQMISQKLANEGNRQQIKKSSKKEIILRIFS